MQYVLDNESAGTVLVGSHVRPAEELVTALRKGSYLCKYGRRGKPKNHYFRLSADDKELLWDSSNGKVRSIALVSVVKVQQGQATEVFSREPLPELEALSFSLIYTEGKAGKKRSLDVVCRNMAEFETWYWGIQLVIAWTQNVAMQQQQQQQLAAQQPVSMSGTAGAPAEASMQLLQTKSAPASPYMSVEKLQEFKQIAAALQPPKAVAGGTLLSAKPTQSQIAVAGVLGAPPPPKREIGDCYIWGDWADAEGLAAAAAGECTLQSSCVPTMVTNTHVLDVIQVAIGAQHAALLTRGGEVYTWGSGQGGKLGNGTSAGSPFPQQVARLAGQGTVAVACGRFYSAAISPEGSLCTWGSGLGGQLGLGPAMLSSVWPTRVAALDGIRVEQVSCGPFHAAAITDDGRLFTWGDGLFGKLGHGDHQTCCSPRPVNALAEHWVISASCGWWHSAAVALARTAMLKETSHTSLGSSRISTGAGSLQGSGHSMSAHAAVQNGAPVRRNAASRASSNGSTGLLSRGVSGSLPDVVGGLFTWGGDFTWQQRGKLDHHEGCLGLGDLLGRSVPTMVKGEDDIKQVACGLNFTVALTRNGEVLQMGRTGAENSREHNAMWEGARVPVLVSGLLSSHYADALACGMSHVAVVATQRKPNGGASGTAATGNNMTRLLTWGQGNRGQLGTGDSREDHLLPQLVSSIAGRRVLYLACGGHYTLAVCQHDPHSVRWLRETLDLDDGHIGSSAAAAAASALITSSGPSRMMLQTAKSTDTAGSLGGPGSERGAAGVGGTRGAGLGLGGMVLSASYNSLASSAQSSSRGEGSAVGGGTGSGGGIGSSISHGLRGWRSERRREARHSDKGSLMGHNSRSNVLTRSADRSCPGSGGGRGAAPLITQSLGVGTCDTDTRGVSFAPAPATVVGGGGSSDRRPMDTSMMSLVSLAKSTKRSRLALSQSSSFKSAIAGGGMPRNDSNNSSSSSRQGWGDSAHRQAQQVVQPPGRSSFRQVSYSSYSAKSEQDLMTLSMNSSISSMTPSPSVHSLHDSRGGCPNDAAEASSVSAAAIAGEDVVKQLRYWQERATNMEQQLSRKTHELEQLRRNMRHSSSKHLAQAPQQQDVQQDLGAANAAQATQDSCSGSSAGSSKAGLTRMVTAPLQQHQQLVVDSEPLDGFIAGDSKGVGVALLGAAAVSAAHAQDPHQQEPGSLAHATASEASSGDGGIVTSWENDNSNGTFRPASLVSWVTGDKTDSAAGSTAVGATATACEQSKRQAESSPPWKMKGRSMSSGESFAFNSLHSEAPTGLATLRGVMSGAGHLQHSLQRGVSLSAGSHVQSWQAQQQTSSGNAMSSKGSMNVSHDETVEGVLQQDLFAGMGTHSSEASRVLALFQQSQRQRQGQEHQQQGQQPPEHPARTPVAVELGGCSHASGGSSSTGLYSPLNTTPAVRTSSFNKQADTGRPSFGMPIAGQRNSDGPSSPEAAPIALSSYPCGVASGGSTAAIGVESELGVLKTRARSLQQQPAPFELVNQQQLQQQTQPHVTTLPSGQELLLLPQVSGLVGSSSSSISNGGSMGGAPGAASNPLAGLQHQRSASVDAGSCQVVTHEVSPGVYLSMQALPTGGYELKRVRFAKQLFSSEDAEHWWAANRTLVYASYNIVLQQPAIPEEQQPLAAVAVSASACAPSEQHQQQEQQQQQGSNVGTHSAGIAGAAAAGGGTAILPVVATVLGQPASGMTSRNTCSTELRSKRVSAGDGMPASTHPHFSSSQGNVSTDEVEPFGIPPSRNAVPSTSSLSSSGCPISVSAAVAAIECGAPLAATSVKLQPNNSDSAAQNGGHMSSSAMSQVERQTSFRGAFTRPSERHQVKKG